MFTDCPSILEKMRGDITWISLSKRKEWIRGKESGWDRFLWKKPRKFWPNIFKLSLREGSSPKAGLKLHLTRRQMRFWLIPNPGKKALNRTECMSGTSGHFSEKGSWKAST